MKRMRPHKNRRPSKAGQWNHEEEMPRRAVSLRNQRLKAIEAKRRMPPASQEVVIDFRRRKRQHE